MHFPERPLLRHGIGMLVASALGAAAGLGSVMIFEARSTGDPDSLETHERRAVPREKTGSKDDGRLTQMERKLADVEDEVRAAKQGLNDAARSHTREVVITGEPDPAWDVRSEPMTFEEEIEWEVQWWSSMVEAFENEVIDPRWSRETTDLLRSGLQAKVENANGLLADVECKATQCRVGIEWPDEQSMRGETGEFVKRSPLNCERHAHFDPDELKAVILFDCGPGKRGEP
jgi:hypothetical protein